MDQQSKLSLETCAGLAKLFKEGVPPKTLPPAILPRLTLEFAGTPIKLQHKVGAGDAGKGHNFMFPDHMWTEYFVECLSSPLPQEHGWQCMICGIRQS